MWRPAQGNAIGGKFDSGLSETPPAKHAAHHAGALTATTGRSPFMLVRLQNLDPRLLQQAAELARWYPCALALLIGWIVAWIAPVPPRGDGRLIATVPAVVMIRPVSLCRLLIRRRKQDRLIQPVEFWKTVEVWETRRSAPVGDKFLG